MSDKNALKGMDYINVVFPPNIKHAHISGIIIINGPFNKFNLFEFIFRCPCHSLLNWPYIVLAQLVEGLAEEWDLLGMNVDLSPSTSKLPGMGQKCLVVQHWYLTLFY
jgi:hypothetical protein